MGYVNILSPFGSTWGTSHNFSLLLTRYFMFSSMQNLCRLTKFYFMSVDNGFLRVSISTVILQKRHYLCIVNQRYLGIEYLPVMLLFTWTHFISGHGKCVLSTNAYNSLRNPRHISAFTKIIKDENRNKENPGYLLISFRDSGVNTALMYTSKSLISRTKLPSANGPDMCWNETKNM